MKLIASVPTVGPRVAVKFATDVRDAVSAARHLDGAAALRFVADQGDIAIWATRNTDKLADFERVQNAIPPGTLNALKKQQPNLVELSSDLAKAFPGDDASARTILQRFTQPSTMLGEGGPEALGHVAAAAEGLRDVSPDLVPAFLRDIDALRNVPGADTWWSKARGGLQSEGDGHVGYAFEASQSAKLLREGKLDEIDSSIPEVLYKGDITNVQVDAFTKTPTGKNVLTEFKSKKDPTKAVGSNFDTRTQMERQAAGVAQRADDLNLEKEVHWRFSSRPTEPLRNYANEMERTYSVRFRFFDADGVEFVPVN